MICICNDIIHGLFTFSECNDNLDIIWENFRYPRRSTIRMRVHEEDLNCIFSCMKGEERGDLQYYWKYIKCAFIIILNMYVHDKINYLEV